MRLYHLECRPQRITRTVQRPCLIAAHSVHIICQGLVNSIVKNKDKHFRNEPEKISHNQCCLNIKSKQKPTFHAPRTVWLCGSTRSRSHSCHTHSLLIVCDSVDGTPCYRRGKLQGIQHRHLRRPSPILITLHLYNILVALPPIQG